MRDRVRKGRTAAPRAVLFVLFALLLTQAAGCGLARLVTAAAETHVHADGSAERRFLLDASPPGPSLNLNGEWSLEAGLNAGERSVARGRIFEDLARDGGGGMSLSVEDRFFWREYAFSDKPGVLLKTGRRATGEVGYKLVMPGRISASPGAVRSAGGVAVYELDTPGGSAEVRAESWKMRWWAVGGTAGGLLSVAALILGGRAARVVRGLGSWLWTGRWSPAAYWRHGG